MKKMIVVLLSAFALLSGGDACFAQVSAARHGGVHPGRDRRPEGYSKDSWTVYYRGLKVEGASASSFVDLGDGYGKDNWKVFYCGEEVKGASASSFAQSRRRFGFVVRKYRQRVWKGCVERLLPGRKDRRRVSGHV